MTTTAPTQLGPLCNTPGCERNGQSMAFLPHRRRELDPKTGERRDHFECEKCGASASRPSPF